jgi:hypothetical protein
MGSLSARKIANMRRLVGALTQGSMGQAATAELLQVSYTAARSYLDILIRAGIVDRDPERRTRYRLQAETSLAERFLSSLARNDESQRVSLRRSTSRHCENPGATFLHVLSDDICFPLVRHQILVRRDPLVAALFGAATAATSSEQV